VKKIFKKNCEKKNWKRIIQQNSTYWRCYWKNIFD